MAKKETNKLSKKGWVSNFNLIGRAKINDYTYKIDEKAEKSDWVYNTLNLGVDCGNNGTIYCEMMGGYGAERDNVIYVHGKKEDKSDDFENRYTIDWVDRNDESITEDVGDMCFLTVGLEKDKNEKTFAKKFLSEYDAIAYIKEHLEDGMIVNVKGSLQYSSYNDNIQTKKIISSVFLSKADTIRAEIKEKDNQIEITSKKLSELKDKNSNESEKYIKSLNRFKDEKTELEEKFKKEYKPKSTFTQTMLLRKDSVGKPDKEKGVLPIYATVIDYTKMWGNKEVKTFVPFNKTFEYECDLANTELLKKIVSKLFKVKKNLTEITFEGDLIEGGAVVTATEDDLTEDIKDLIDLHIMSIEEALDKCVEGTSREKRMVIRKPLIKMVGEDGEKTPQVQKFEDKLTEDDLILDFMIASDDEDDENDQYEDVSNNSTSDDDLSFLDLLD